LEYTVLRHTGPIVALIVAVSANVAAQGPSPNQALPQATVSSMGEAVIRRAPDRAFIVLTTESKGQTPQEAQAKGVAAMTAVQKALDGLKLQGGQVMTTGMNLSADYEFSNNQRVMRGYVDRHTIMVRLDDVARAGEVMTVATASGATNVSGVRFDRSDREALEEEALKLAVGVARARAEALAAGAGKTIDRIVRIAEERVAFDGGGPQPQYRAAMQESAAVGGAVPIASGEIEIRMRAVLTATIR
jgi:hypothetical protein